MNKCVYTEALEVAETDIPDISLYYSGKDLFQVGGENLVEESTHIKLIRVTFGNNHIMHPDLYKCCDAQLIKMECPKLHLKGCQTF